MKKFLFSTTVLAIFACLLWATPFTAIKIGLKYTTPLQFAGIRFLLSGLIILPFIKDLKYKILESKKRWRFILWVALLQTTFLYGLFYTGISFVPGALAAMLIGSQPLFAAVFAHFMLANDKMSWKKIFAIILGITGVCIISLGRADFVLTTTIPLGVGILILNNIVGSTGNVIVSRDAKDMPPRVLASFSMIIGGAVLILISIPIENPSWNTIHPGEYYLSLAWLAMVSAFAITIWFGLLQRPGVKVSNLNTWKFIVPIFGASLSWLVLPDEHPDLLSIIGMIVIACSLLFVNYLNRRVVK
ncbi:DMT family transporter [Labilibaculum euxinus]|uniref:EamA family transporter n=1 Tax=Labilibaculum euxinus TaxID=2686357 RepID=A0A7M4D6Y5_9BACT|nr:DMT family transporter [Labilibaculum euxinus]MUP38414.1 EamA family transporter [Labilibaculum euxinus]MVB07619.1 EamA family transporter [Labilibaculum euxinus]